MEGRPKMKKVFEEILAHPYYKKIKEMCYNDDKGTDIENWIKNTVNADSNIPAEAKISYYLSAKKINEYKRLLQTQTKEMMVDMEVPVPIISTNVQTSQSQLVLNTAEPIRNIVVKDTERNVLRFQDTFMNLIDMVNDSFVELRQQLKDRGFADPQEIKNLRGFLVELRNLLALYAKLSGQEALVRTMAEGVGEKIVENLLTDSKKSKLKEYVKDLLAEVQPEKIPVKLAELESILNA